MNNLVKEFLDEFDEIINSVSDTTKYFYSSVPTVQKLPKTLCSNYFPPTNIMINKETLDLTYEMAVAGYLNSEIKITYDDEHLILELDCKTENSATQKVIQQGIKKSKTITKYLLPSSKYDITKIESTLLNGILTIKVPVLEKAKPIDIRISNI